MKKNARNKKRNMGGVCFNNIGSVESIYTDAGGRGGMS